MKLLVFDCLFDDDKELSDPMDRSSVRSGSRFLMTFIIGVKSYMRVTNVTLDIYVHIWSGTVCRSTLWQLLLVKEMG